MPLNRLYWESLDVSIDDIIENETKLSDVQERLEHKLEDTFGACHNLIKNNYNISGRTLYDSLTHLFIHSRDDFRELYALAVYSENKVNSDFILQLANKSLKTGMGEQIVQQTGSVRSLLLPVYKANPDLLKDVHYAHILQCKPVREFRLHNDLVSSLPFNTLNEQKIDEILEEFEEKSKTKIKLPSKVWRYKTDGKTALIVFRREKRLRSKLSKVEKNEYHKTGNQKIILFKNGGNSLEICSKDQKTVKISQFIVYKMTNQKIKYDEIISQYELKKVKQFIDDVVAKRVEDCLLQSIRIQNVALKNSSPTIELFCDDDLAPVLADLSTNNGLPLLDKIEELLSFRIKLRDRMYTIRTIISENLVTFLLDNRNIGEENKNALLVFLEEHLR